MRIYFIIRSSASDLASSNGKRESNGFEFFLFHESDANGQPAARLARGSSLSNEARPWLRFNANDWFSWCFDWILSSASYRECHHPS